MKTLVLASTSVYRQELLNRLRLPFQALAPQVDEDSEKNKNLSPRELAEHLATLKARSLARPNTVVIGGDQLVQFNGKILGKPGHRDKAIQQIQSMAGKTHELITSVCVCEDKEEILFTDITRMTLRDLSLQEIERYVDADQPFDCAGAYKIEKLGITLMAKIESEDFTAIQGLPLIKLSEVLRQKGFFVP